MPPESSRPPVRRTSERLGIGGFLVPDGGPDALIAWQREIVDWWDNNVRSQGEVHKKLGPKEKGGS